MHASDEMYQHTHDPGTLRVNGSTRALAGGGTLTESLRDPVGDQYQLSGATASAGGTAQMNIVQPTIIIAWYIRVL